MKVLKLIVALSLSLLGQLAAHRKRTVLDDSVAASGEAGHARLEGEIKTLREETLNLGQTVSAPEGSAAMPTVGTPCDVNLEIPDIQLPQDSKWLKGTVERPNGKEEPLETRVAPDGTLAITFTPAEPGLHKVFMKKSGRPVKGSPFEVMVVEPKVIENEPRIGNPYEVNLEIPDIQLPRDLKWLKGTVERPNGKEEPLDTRVAPDGTLAVTFTPAEPGLHKIFIKKRGRPVKGSPFEVMVVEPKVIENDPRVGTPCDVSLETPDIQLPQDLKWLKGTVERPNGKEEPLDTRVAPDGTLVVTFTPAEPGLHKIFIKKRGRPVKGSPFEVMAGEAKD